ncbi:MAG: hypothetical protein ACOC22_03380 [bacterium]
MPTVVTNDFRKLMATDGVNLSADTYKVALMDDFVTSVAETLKQSSDWTSVSANEVSGTGYSAATLIAPTVSVNSSDVVYWDGSNITWDNVTVSPYGCAIYRTNDNLVVGYIEFTDAPKIAVNGTIAIQWNENGIMNIY